MKNKIITQTTNIKKKLFSNKKRITLSTLTFLLIGGIILFGANYFAKGATYGWTQSSWVAGITGNTATHPDDGTWDEYSAKDSNITAGSTVSITSSIQTLTHDDSTDFSGGTSSGVITTDDEIKLDLP